MDGSSQHKRKEPPALEPSSPHKRVKLLSEHESSASDSTTSSGAGGVAVRETTKSSKSEGFTINSEYAQRFEHNKKREELHRLEEKYGKDRGSARRSMATFAEDEDNSHGTDSNSESEDEDDDGVLASEALDAQIDATLRAIRSKDPRVYDESATFYTDMGDEALGATATKRSKDKPMYLSDYHREHLLAGSNEADGDNEQPATYTQLQDDLRTTIVQEMHAAADGSLGQEPGVTGDVGSDSGDDFLVRKPRTVEHVPYRAPPKHVELNVEAADQDPDTYLSNFMAARAWLPSAGPQFKPFESDDDEEDQRAEAFENAYNLRFENPANANEKLMSHARDAAAKYSVRKETTNTRKKARDAERAKKDLEKQEREEEKARLRKLQVADMEEKVRKIKEAAGLRGKAMNERDWSTFLDEGWDDARWEAEMKKRFGDEYYADNESEPEICKNGHGKRKFRKPKWEDDIDIKDLVPDFDAAEELGKRHFSLAEEDGSGSPVSLGDRDTDEQDVMSNKYMKAKQNRKGHMKREKEEERKEARRERRMIEKMVEERLNAEDTISGVGVKKSGYFRYRETSPSAFGLTANDILMASDSQLNQYAGLKKMAAFRDIEKKRKDKKRLGKKARLREWRRETFGSEEGPQKTLAELLPQQEGGEEATSKPDMGGANVFEEEKKKKKRKRSKKHEGRPT